MTLAADHLASSTTPITPDCVRRAELFLDPLLEEPPTAGTPAAVRCRAAALTAEASSVCVNCPLMIECLYRAVVSHDVAGFVAGTTERQRAAIRARLGVVVAPEDFDTLAGVSGGHRQVDHTEIVRLRRTHPDESLERLARRLGCSLSTVKRHLRRERRSPSRSSAPPPQPSRTAVLTATASVLGRAERPQAA
jgi:DNA-binding CsgD family transcriptional regulator